MQKDANLAELEKCCQTHIFLQNFDFRTKFRFDTAENEPAKNLQIFAKKIISLNGTCEGEGEESGPHLLVGAAEAGGQGGLLLLRRAEVRAELARLPGKGLGVRG